MSSSSALSPKAAGLSISVVVYRPDIARLESTLKSVARACAPLLAASADLPVVLYMIDNGGLGDVEKLIGMLNEWGVRCKLISGHGNVGYGRGHNLAINLTGCRYHLVLNPDIDLDPTALATACAFLDHHPDTGLLAPYIADDAGCIQYLCRRYPALFDLIVRGFMPAKWKAQFDVRLAQYEMRDRITDRNVVWDPPIVSGCFMLFRTEVLKKLGGFDPRYFLYFEDYDLSLRTHDVARVAYVPSVRVIHHGGGASRKGFAHIRMFAASAFKFYNHFGWRLW
ncbi:Glycosyltransferase [Burkholderia latens]|uniref:glycosyltransferase family 2 protein n=1 Tax=Burkholderia latens TaxID=488446 RepID=UPI0039A40805